MSRQLDKAISASETRIPANLPFTTAEFPPEGILLIDSEKIRYSNTAGQEFIQCSRGFQGTTAVTHAKGATITFVTSVPTNPELNTTLELTSPSSLVADNVDSADVISVSTIISDTLVLTLPTPSVSTAGRLVTVVHKSGSAGTLSINTIDLAAGESKEFVWDGTGWTSSPSGGGAGASAALDNLASVAINDVLLPGVDDSIDLGSAAKRFQDLFLSADIHLNNGQKVILGNTETSWLQYNVNTDTIEFALNSGNQTDLTTPAGLTITGNTGLDGSGAWSPYIELHPSDHFTVWTNGAANAGLRVDSSATADDTRLLLWDVTAGTLKRVSRGAADSGGVGYRVIRIPN